MNILITGATGLIGSSLCKALLDLNFNYSITIYSRQNLEHILKKIGSIKSSNIKLINNIDDISDVNGNMQFDAVINLAGEPIFDKRWTLKQKETITNSRVNLTQKLSEKILQSTYKPKIFISASAIGIYGDTGGIDINDNYTNKNPNDFASQLCAQWEKAAVWVSSDQTRVCLLRTGLVLSSSGGIFKKMLLPFKLGIGSILGDGSQYMSWIHIEDYIAILIKILHDKDSHGSYNMVSPNPISNKNFSLALANSLHRPLLFKTPAWFLRHVLGERSLLILGGQKVFPTKVLAMNYNFIYDNVFLALKNLV
jgi:uncharacterized protein